MRLPKDRSSDKDSGVCDLLISISQETLVKEGGKQDKEGEGAGYGVILHLIVGSLNLPAELPHLEAKGLGFVPSYQSLVTCWG